MITAIEIATKSIKEHEGYSATPYRCPAGVLTIGYGRNLERGISKGEANVLLWNDLRLAELDAMEFAGPAWLNLDTVRRAVLIDMAFNLGYPRLSTFKNLQAFLFVKDYDRCAEEMLDSRWAIQTGDRAVNLAARMRSGV